MGLGYWKYEGIKDFCIRIFLPFVCVKDLSRLLSGKNNAKSCKQSQGKHQNDRVVASKIKYCSLANSVYCIKIDFSFTQHHGSNTMSSISPSFISLVEKITYETPLVLVCINSQLWGNTLDSRSIPDLKVNARSFK